LQRYGDLPERRLQPRDTAQLRRRQRLHDGHLQRADGLPAHACVRGTSRADTNVCNGAETCLGCVCGPGTALNCDDGNPCTADTCNSVTGCAHTPVPNGTPCLDGNVCNGSETCQAGSCTAGTPLVCDDQNPCTTDSCNALVGCQHVAVPSGTSCADNTVCNGNETCQSGLCTTGTPRNCNDGNACTTACSHPLPHLILP